MDGGPYCFSPRWLSPDSALRFFLASWYGWLAMAGSDLACATGQDRVARFTGRRFSALPLAALCASEHNFANGSVV
jgi:hypothetical protein